MIKLKEIRKEKKLTQKDIADKLAIKHVQVSRVESGIQTLNSNQIIKLCNDLNISADELLGLKERKII